MMQQFDSKTVISVSGSIAPKGEKGTPVLQCEEASGGFAVSLKGEAPRAGLCIGLAERAVEPGCEITVRGTVQKLYHIVESKMAHFTAAVSGLVEAAAHKVDRVYKTFRRSAGKRVWSRRRVLIYSAGGLRL